MWYKIGGNLSFPSFRPQNINRIILVIQNIGPHLKCLLASRLLSSRYEKTYSKELLLQQHGALWNKFNGTVITSSHCDAKSLTFSHVSIAVPKLVIAINVHINRSVQRQKKKRSVEVLEGFINHSCPECFNMHYYY